MHASKSVGDQVTRVLDTYLVLPSDGLFSSGQAVRGGKTVSAYEKIACRGFALMLALRPVAVAGPCE
jgi:hypothetical protein